MVRQKNGNEDWGDQRNASLGLGCYCLDATFENVKYVFDATASINDPGRYINHASKNYNLLKMQPVLTGGRLRMGFVARRDIKYGEELFFHYGLKSDPDLPWITTDAKKISTTLQDQSHSSRDRYLYLMLMHYLLGNSLS